MQHSGSRIPKIVFQNDVGIAWSKEQSTHTKEVHLRDPGTDNFATRTATHHE